MLFSSDSNKGRKRTLNLGNWNLMHYSNKLPKPHLSPVFMHCPLLPTLIHCTRALIMWVVTHCFVFWKQGGTFWGFWAVLWNVSRFVCRLFCVCFLIPIGSGGETEPTEQYINEDKKRGALGELLYPILNSTLTWAERIPPRLAIQTPPRGTTTSRSGKREKGERESERMS